MKEDAEDGISNEIVNLCASLAPNLKPEQIQDLLPVTIKSALSNKNSSGRRNGKTAQTINEIKLKSNVCAQLLNLHPHSNKKVAEKFLASYNTIPNDNNIPELKETIKMLHTLSKINNSTDKSNRKPFELSAFPHNAYENSRKNIGTPFSDRNLSDISNVNSPNLSREPAATSSRESSFRTVVRGSSLNILNNVGITSSSTPKAHEAKNVASPHSVFKSTNRFDNKERNSASTIPDVQLFKSLISCMQGFSNNIFQADSQNEGFALSSEVIVKKRYHLARLMELGYLFKKVNKLLDELSSHRSVILIAAIKNGVKPYIAHYYRDLAEISSAVDYTASHGSSETDEYRLPTVNDIARWMREHFTNFQQIVAILCDINGRKSCEILSSLWIFMRHANPKIKEISTNIMSEAIYPFYNNIYQWVVNGVLDDPYEEFFVEYVSSNEENAWGMQYFLRTSSLPNFMNTEDAERILKAGQCVNFLRSDCKEKIILNESQKIIKAIRMEKDSEKLLSLLDHRSELWAHIYSTHEHSSNQLLSCLMNKFKLGMHLDAIRKYLLLGQGDFIQYLMDTIEIGSNVDGRQLHQHQLNEFLRKALHATSSEYESKDVISKLTIKNLPCGMPGWDMFAMSYNLNSPLSKIINMQDRKYERVFGFLWRLKRAEYYLSKIWRQMLCITKTCSVIPEITQVCHTASVLLMEMLSFVNHLQYHTNFKIIRSSWLSFEKEVASAHSLEKLLNAHDIFLNTLMKNTVSINETVGNGLRMLLDYVLEIYQKHQEFEKTSLMEMKRRKDFMARVDNIGYNYQEEESERKHQMDFALRMRKIKSGYKLTGKYFRDTLKALLLDLTKSNDSGLLELLQSIDYNKFYMQNDAQLSESVRLALNNSDTI